MGFWENLDKLVQENTLIIDRPKNSAHPRYPDSIYPVDYGYLEDTHSGDGHGIDVWRGTLPDNTVQAFLVTVDMIKKDSEIKLVVGCTEEEINLLYPYTKSYSMASILVKRENCISAPIISVKKPGMINRRAPKSVKRLSFWNCSKSIQLYETAVIFSTNIFLKFIRIAIPTNALSTISKKVINPPMADEIFTEISTSRKR